MRNEIAVKIGAEETRFLTPEYDPLDAEFKRICIDGICLCVNRAIQAKLSPETTPVIIQDKRSDGTTRCRFDIDPVTRTRKMLA